MARIINESGALGDLLADLNNQNIYKFKSLEEIQSFKNDIPNLLIQIKQKNREYIFKNIEELESRCERLTVELEGKIQARNESLQLKKVEVEAQFNSLAQKTGILNKFLYRFRRKQLLGRKNSLKFEIENGKETSFRELTSKINKLKEEYEDKKTNTDKWVDSLSEKEIDKIGFFQRVMDDSNNCHPSGEIALHLFFKEFSKLK